MYMQFVVCCIMRAFEMIITSYICVNVSYTFLYCWREKRTDFPERERNRDGDGL